TCSPNSSATGMSKARESFITVAIDGALASFSIRDRKLLFSPVARARSSSVMFLLRRQARKRAPIRPAGSCSETLASNLVVRIVFLLIILHHRTGRPDFHDFLSPHASWRLSVLCQ